MRTLNPLLVFAGIMLLPLSAQAQNFRAESDEYRTFFGIDTVSMEALLKYDNGEEEYKFTTVRFRYGIESDKGGSAGIEFMTPADDKTVDPFGDEFELETGPSIGAYFTVGKPVYLRVGLSFTQFEYTDVASGVSDDDSVAAIDLGIGFNHTVNNQFTLYGEFTRRDTDEVNFNTFFGGQPSHRADYISVGVNYLF